MISKPHMRQMLLQDVATAAVQHTLSPKCPLYAKFGIDSYACEVIGVEPMLDDDEEIVGFVFVAQMPEVF